MKTKHGLIGSLSIGIIAGILRVIQYITAMDGEGYYTSGALSAFLGGMLVGLMAVGTVWSLLAGRKQKEQIGYAGLFPGKNLFLILMGVVSAADGIYRLVTAAALLPRIVAILCLAGALSWLLIGLLGHKTPALLGLFPIVQLGGMLIAYFWETYKYIQVSEYALVVLALSAACFFTMLVMKSLAGADCTKGRLTAAACLMLTFGAPAFLASLAGGISSAKLFLAAEGLLMTLLAAVVLCRLPALTQKPEPTEAPDLSALNEYINNIPEVEENENENT